MDDDRTRGSPPAQLIFPSGGAYTAQARERLDELGAPQLEKPVPARELRACVSRPVSETGPPPPS